MVDDVSEGGMSFSGRRQACAACPFQPSRVPPRVPRATQQISKRIPNSSSSRVCLRLFLGASYPCQLTLHHECQGTVCQIQTQKHACLHSSVPETDFFHVANMVMPSNNPDLQHRFPNTGHRYSPPRFSVSPTGLYEPPRAPTKGTRIPIHCAPLIHP